MSFLSESSIWERDAEFGAGDAAILTHGRGYQQNQNQNQPNWLISERARSSIAARVNSSVSIVADETSGYFTPEPSKKISISTQTGKKVSKVRWVQDGQSTTIPDRLATEYFLSGSRSELENEVCLWRLKINGSDDDLVPISQTDLVYKLPYDADITDIAMLSWNSFAITTSKGELIALRCVPGISGDLESIEQLARVQLHKTKYCSKPATSVSARDHCVVTVGEDGSIYESSLPSCQTLRAIENADPLTIYAVTHIERTTILTGNAGGQLKLWDLRNPSNIPCQIMNPNVLMNNLYGAISLAPHPSQNHLVIVGYQSGCMDLWDLRGGSCKDPVANLASDGGSLSEIYFHGINPDHFFSCSQAGVAAQWYPANELQDNSNGSSSNLNIEFMKRGLIFRELYVSPFPINSMNISKNDRLVCGGDNGIVFCSEISLAT